MSLYSEWKARAENLESDAAYQQYWSNYFSQETEVYKQVLLSHDKPLSRAISTDLKSQKILLSLHICAHQKASTHKSSECRRHNRTGMMPFSGFFDDPA